MTEQQEDIKNLLASRFLARVRGYSWVKFGWETATSAYENVKQSSRLSKYGCELAEANLSKVASSPLVAGTVSFLAPLIVVADEYSVRQLDKVEKGADIGQQIIQKAIAPVAHAYTAVTSVPSRLLDRAEAMVDYYLPEEKHKGDEGPAAEKSPRKKREGIRASSVFRTYELAFTTAKRAYCRLGYENLKAQATEKLQSHETLNDIIVYMRTSDPERKEKLIKKGRDVYWNFRNNYKAIFIQSARAVVQPYLVSPALKLYNSAYSFWDRTLKRVLLRGPFSPAQARPGGNAAA